MKQLFTNATVLTMDNRKECNSFTVENGRFTLVGESVDRFMDEDTEVISLDGKTVLPAFIDVHSHLTSYANSFLQANLVGVDSVHEIIDIVMDFGVKNNVGPGGILIGAGYDHNILPDKKHPAKGLLDEAFPDTAVILQHKSGHFGVFNTVALEKVGCIGKDIDGYLEENEFITAIKKVPMPAPEQLLEGYRRALDSYASYGITTIQEGMMLKQMLPLYQMLLQNHILTLDVVGYPQIADADVFYETFGQQMDSESYSSGERREEPYSLYNNSNFRLGGYKIILDGSPQGRTAWMKTAYLGSDNEFGVSTMTDAEVRDAIHKSVHDRRQLLVHCNGDAAVEQLLTAAESTANPEELRQIRPVIIHAQLLSDKQLPRVKQLGMIPSFFIAHCYYWGDTHIENFGLERASSISPARSALEQSVLFTFHQDTPVIEPNMLETVQCAVTRKTRNGIILGADERISVYEALKAVTIHAAYQYGEENDKGSITPGKKADFVILNENPIQVPPDRIMDIKILATYRAGRKIFSGEKLS